MVTDRALIERLKRAAIHQERTEDCEAVYAAIDRLEALTGGEASFWALRRTDTGYVQTALYKSKLPAIVAAGRRTHLEVLPLYLSPPSGRGVGREDIARVIEEGVWAKVEHHGGVQCIIYSGIDETADAILALFSSPSLGGEGKQEDRPSRGSQNDQCADAGPFSRSHGGERVLILASYCGGDNPSCSDAHPCNDCLAMCNVAITTGDLHIIGELSSTPDPQAQQDDAASVLSDPHAVHLNMLRGGLAKLTPAQIGHLYRGEEAEAVIAELRRQNPKQDVGER